MRRTSVASGATSGALFIFKKIFDHFPPPDSQSQISGKAKNFHLRVERENRIEEENRRLREALYATLQLEHITRRPSELIGLGLDEEINRDLANIQERLIAANYDLCTF
jgi:hypothetical protein